MGSAAPFVARTCDRHPCFSFRNLDLRPADVLVIDLRRSSAEERQAISKIIDARTLVCRAFIIDTRDDTRAASGRASLRILLDPTEPAAPYVAAIHSGLGHHDVLIDAMRHLTPHLGAVGCAAVVDILSSRFACRNVAGLAALWRMHRTRLHHMLSDDGDPGPKQLYDSCLAAVTLLLLSRTSMRLGDIARFVRATHSRVPYEALRRRIGSGVADILPIDSAQTERALLDRVVGGAGDALPRSISAGLSG